MAGAAIIYSHRSHKNVRWEDGPKAPGSVCQPYSPDALPYPTILRGRGPKQIIPYYSVGGDPLVKRPNDISPSLH
jgi:hypothetical protein